MTHLEDVQVGNVDRLDLVGERLECGLEQGGVTLGEAVDYDACLLLQAGLSAHDHFRAHECHAHLLAAHERRVLVPREGLLIGDHLGC